MCNAIEYAEVLSHGPLEEIVPNIFVVKGAYKAVYGEDTWQFSRNMVVVRDQDDLTLINSIRLDDAGLEKLKSLGSIKNVIKLGAAHGTDDAYYVKEQGARLWVQEGDQDPHGLSADEVLSESNTPSEVLKLHSLESTKPEALIVVDMEGGVLVSCDSIKNWDKVDGYFSPESGENMTQYGMIKPMDINMSWVESCGISGDKYKQLLSHTFKHFVPGHGSVVMDDAYGIIEQAIVSAFSD